jgi:hypothetical protein
VSRSSCLLGRPPSPLTRNPYVNSSAAAAAGGAVGGLAIVAILILAIFHCRRQRKQLQSQSANPEVTTPSFIAQSIPAPPYAAVPFLATAASNVRPSAAGSSPDRRTTTDAIVTTASASPEPLSQASAVPTGSRKSRDARQSTASATITASGGPRPLSQASVVPASVVPAQLTDEQADFINNLHLHNVPTGAIARVMERMLAGRDPGVIGSGSQTRVVDNDAFSRAPPSYE